LEEDGFNFCKKFRDAVDRILKREVALIEAEKNDTKKIHMMNNLTIKSDQFDSIFDVKRHELLKSRGERKFSHKALMGAIMISLYKEETR
jgi:tryptophan 2,3-dioxygenase